MKLKLSNLILQIGKVSGEKTTFGVTGLDEGEMYEFRVTAITEEGESDHLLTDCAIKAKNPFGKLLLLRLLISLLTRLNSNLFIIKIK